jgi:hypothetical protein
MTKQEKLDAMLRSREDIRKTAEDLTERIRGLRLEIEREETLEISCDCAPNSGSPWSRFDHEQLQDKLASFVYDRARVAGRSTSSIRHRIAEVLAPRICAGKWHEMGRKTKKEERYDGRD